MLLKPNYLLIVMLTLGVIGCREEDDPVTPGGNGSVEVLSDPAGASIELGGVSTGKITPNILTDLSGRQQITVRLIRDFIEYGFRADVDVRADSVHRIIGPLLMRCVSVECLIDRHRDRDIGRMRISTQANGGLFLFDLQSKGLLWPAGVNNSYAATGMPMIGMVTTTRDTLALGIYDIDYLNGRPAPAWQSTTGTAALKQWAWIMPPNIIVNTGPTVRGIEVEEELSGTADPDVALLKLTFRNITNKESYRAIDPLVPNIGMRFEHVYIGFALDPDVGLAEDDLITYESDLELVYAYDSNFQEPIFGEQSASPALVGLKLVSAPPNAVKVLNAWPNALGNASGDWRAGTTTAERAGYAVLSGLRSFPPDATGQHIGFYATTPADYRLSVSAGPLTLDPGDEASITVAIIIAPPVQGEYLSGQTVLPGGPTAQDRKIQRIAENLLNKARAVVAP